MNLSFGAGVTWEAEDQGLIFSNSESFNSTHHRVSGIDIEIHYSIEFI